MTPTDLQIALGDATTVPEETAFAAYQTLREARTNPELAANPALSTSREALRSYVTERRRHGHDLFPNVTAAANRERNDSLAALYTKPLEKALPEKAYADLTRKMEFVPDPETFKMREINRTFLSATVGKPIPPERYDTIRTIYAKQHLGLDKDTSDAAVFTAIKTRFDEELGSTEKLREIAKAEFESILGGTIPTELPDLSAIPERLRPQVSDQILATRRQSKERIRQAMPAVREIMPALKEEAARLASGEMQGLPHLALMDRLAASLPRDPVKKEIAIALIAREMQKLPEQDKGALARILTSIERGTDNAVLAAVRAPLEAGAAIRNMLPAGAEQKRTAADNLTIRTDAQNLRKAFLGEIDPLRKPGDNIAVESLVLAGESAWTIPATLAGPIGWGAMASSFAGNSFQDARTMNPEASAGAQMGAAAISGPAQAAAEVVLNKVGFKIIGGKLPGLAGILNKSGVFNPAARAAIAATTSGAAIGATEYAEEAVQGGIDRLAQDLALEFSNIAPDTDWKGFWGNWLTLGGAEQRDTLLAVLPFAVVGAGGASFQHFRYGSQLAKNRTVLDAIGVPPSVVDEMVNTTDVKKTDELFRQAWETGLEERTAEQKKAALDVMREINSLTAAAGLDRITRDSEFTYTYTDPLTNESREFETEEEALLHWRQQALSASQSDLDTIALTSREDLLNFLTSEGKASEETMIDEQERTLTLPQAVKEGIATPEQIDSRVRIFILQNGLTPAQAAKEVESLTIRARSYTQQSRDGQYRYAVQLFKNADPLDVFEDFAEDSIKRAFDDSLADPRRILRDIRAYEGASNTRLIAPDYEYDPDNTLPLVEGFSALARALVIGNARADLLPPAVSQWIEVAATYGANTIDLARSAITADLQRAGELKKALSAGQVPTELVSRLEDAIGINEAEVLRRLEQKHNAQLAAEAMGGFPEIRDMAEGLIPHPETLRKNQHPLAGEVRRIWDSLKKPTRRRDRQGRTIDRTNEANAYFLPVGEMADLDKLRESLNEKGFDFQTPADLLDALESSISYNKPVYATGSRGNDSFAIGRGTDTTGGIDTNSPGGANIGDAASPSSVVTPEMDADYLAAVKSGNLVKASRIMNQAARNAGAILDDRWDSDIAKTWFHGSSSSEMEGGQIDLGRAGQSGHSSEKVFFLTDRPSEAAHYAVSDWPDFSELYDESSFGNYAEDGILGIEDPFVGSKGGRIFPFFIIPKSAARLDGKATGAGSQGSGALYWEINSTAEELTRQGHDVVLLDNMDVTSGGFVSNHAVVADPSSIVSASVIERDSEGNIIPLSQRFKQSSPAASGDSFSLGRSTVTPTASTQTFQGQDGQAVIGPASFAIGAFHGTPHKVDKFATAKIGTGEGAQAYGWGLYFADAMDVAAQYSNLRATPDMVVRADGNALKGLEKSLVETYFSEGRAAAEIAARMNGPEWKQAWERVKDKKLTRGNLYRVTLKVEEEDLLDWDKPLAEQSKPIKERLKKAGIWKYLKDLESDFSAPSIARGREKRGHNIYAAVTHKSGSEQQASRTLAAAGIRGIRYLDGNSRSTGQGSYNYVIFDEADIEILEENGQPVSPPITDHRSPGTSLSLGPAAFARLEQAIAAKMTAAPDERAEFYSRVRDRLAATQQRLEDMDNGVGVFARQPTDEAGEERRRIQDAIAEARAIIGALPPEARGRVEMDFEDITAKTTDKGRVKALIRLMDKADIALEKVLQSAYLESITRILDLAQPDLRQNRSVRGRLTPETQRLINAILPLTRLTPIEASAEQVAAQASFDALDNQFPDPEDDAAVEAWESSLAAAQERLDLIDTFASLSTQTSAELAAARKHLLQIYTKGRTARQMLDQAKRSETASQRREVLESLGGLPSQAKWKKRVDDKGFLDRMEGYRLGLVSFHEMMEWMFPNSIAARDYQKRIRDAERSVSRARIDARQRWENFAFTAFNLTGRSRKRRLNRILADLSTARDDWNIEIAEGRRSETVKMSEEQAASILDGTLKPGWETDPIAMESLRQALADFRMKRKAAQDQDKAFQGKVIRFERITQRGAPTFVRMSDMEAVYFLQLAAQSQYLPALDKYGFTEKVLNQIRAKIDPRALTIMSHLRSEYDMQYQRLNPVHQRLFGLDMPQIRNYAPGAFESMDGKQDPNISPDGTGGALSAMSAGFTKARTHHMARPRQANALALYWSSLEQTEHFIAWAEVMRDMRQIFRSPDVRRTLEAAYGSRAGAEFSTWLDILETDGRSRAAESLSLTQTFNQILTAQSAIGLAFNIGTVFKQWSAGIGHFMLMPTGAAIKATYKALTSPKTLRDVWNSEAVQQRITQGISPEDRRLLEAANASPSLAMELLEIGRLPISLADGAFTTLMGAAAYRYQYDEATRNGLPDSQAHTAALAHMDMVITRAAQPATTQDKSSAENTARGFSKALFLFKSDPRQKFAIALTAIRLATRGDIKTPEAFRRVFFSWAVYGLMAQIASDMWRAISRDDDDAELWEPKDYIAAMIAGPLAGVPVIGSGIEVMLRSMVGAQAYTNNANPLDKVAERIARYGFTPPTITAMTAEDVDFLEILSAATADSSTIAQFLAFISPATAIVPAILRPLRDLEGIRRNVIGAFSGDTPEDIAARIVREEKEADKKPAENRKQTLDTLAKELAAMPAAQREKRLRQLDADTRTAINSRLRKADMTPSERSLASLAAPARSKAIARILAELEEQDRKPYLDRLQTLGLAPED